MGVIEPCLTAAWRQKAKMLSGSILILLVCSCGRVPHSESIPGHVSPSDQWAREARDVLEEAAARHHAREAVLLAITPESGKTRAIGSIDAEPRDLASVSKLFVAAAMVVLSDSAEVDLDAPVAESLWPEAGIRLPEGAVPTLRQLLCHTSGLAGEGSDLQPVTPPGLRFHYANGNYEIIARFLETQVGEPWPQSLTTVLQPAGASPHWFLPGTGTPGAMGLAMRPEDLEEAARWLASSGLAQRLYDEGCETAMGYHPAGWLLAGEARGRVERLGVVGSARNAGIEWRHAPRTGRSLILMTRSRYSPPFFDQVLGPTGERFGLGGRMQVAQTLPPPERLVELAEGSYRAVLDQQKTVRVESSNATGLTLTLNIGDIRRTVTVIHRTGLEWGTDLQESPDLAALVTTMEVPEVKLVPSVDARRVEGILILGQYFARDP